MANGLPAHPGAAACGYAWETGTSLLIVATNQVVTCADRGAGPWYWVDVWGGSYTGWSEVEVIE